MADFKIDLARYGKWPWLLQPSLYAILVYRIGRWGRLLPPLQRRLFTPIYFLLYSVVRLAVGIDVPRSVILGPGCMIHHYGGIIINPQAVIGSGFEVRHNVTIGNLQAGGRAPIIGNDVVVGVGASILGPVTVGNGARIGAHALVSSDVPPGGRAFGPRATVKG